MDVVQGSVADSAESNDATDTSDPNDRQEEDECASGPGAYVRVILDGWSRYSGCAIPFAAGVVALGAMLTFELRRL
ncbi:MAG TPA: hypothetical protein VMO88_09410 [Acidimicrobiales bacterium]|nr:hypothetical protein [Acidimicrobiales bacterium]